MNDKDNHALQIQALLLRAQLDRVQLRQDTQNLRHSLRPEVIRSDLVHSGSQAVAGLLPSATGMFDFLQKYPGLSISIAKALLRATKVSNPVTRSIAIALASWFVYKRFK